MVNKAMVYYTDAQKAAYYRRKAAGSARRYPQRTIVGRGDYKVINRFKSNYRKPYQYPGAGARIGKSVGGFVGRRFPRIGGKDGATIGKYLGQGAHSLVKTVTGFGDYSVRKNALVYNQDAVPEFANSERCTVITHREFIADIKSSTSFSLNSFRINPTVSDTFPWLSAIAQNYEQYVVQGMIFEYKTTSAVAMGSTNTALGTVVLATQYNSLSPLFDNKQQMENYEFSQSTVPSQSVLHAVECDPTQTQCGGILNMWNANDSSDGDIRLYDLGRFNIATVGMQTANVPIGELWVSYKICCLKPRLVGVTDVADVYVLDAASVATNSPLGNVANAVPKVYNSGITTLNSGTSIGVDPTFVGLLQVTYCITYDIDVTVCQMPGITLVAGSKISDVTPTFTDTGYQSVNGKGGIGGNALFVTHYLKCDGGYIVSTGSAPVFVLSSFTITGDAPLSAVVSIISMPDNMVGSL
uniref:Putative capsid n=1 Tax=uncultured virus TaxID=340016 RepID=A0A1D8MK00_9VIRU|nr:putative capsid [uncultured virus]